ncbi:DNA polymerase delta small subunit Cdc1 [Yamadazyma tenuis]|uniref:DNA-directed DNA polymerase n=1 Tax=Candida tenuis (strain ATCC 10573 / BCRC 21748 / CBS 615 / JCM 9827 / NBRC 10315 / NRRL Y-1498 / VKM Y-70) TaxID=590646 RepID=G3B4H0_CANTC|nr:uncharacterized protein CANTEDRAFT_130212 [Yamadazyma tenuis ATCC 10573]EGV63825.1 hypothetical protein CANTEDRAFT_130212 [Yamadazyma tenuis ATCC 10573]WEJ96566.1 DNA polymerase delta small subunit Cdc1 [Yamadazyma tenuis]
MMKYQDYIHSADDGIEPVIKRREPCIPDDYDKKNEFDLANTGRRYDHQFSSMYQSRMNSLKSRVDEQAMAKWGNGTLKRDGQIIQKVDRILNITSNKLCWVSGTVFCDLGNKLNILNDVKGGTDDVLPQIPDSYRSQDVGEVVMLEDESGRAVLEGDEFFKENILVTGVIVAVLGIELQAGVFEIIDVIYPSVAPQRSLPTVSDRQGTKIAFVSGLEITESVNYDLKLELLKQYLQGEIGESDDKQSVAQISQVVIAGSSIKELEQANNDDYHSSNNYGSKNISRFSAECLKSFDKFVSDLVATCSVAIMPGESDPTDICLPQQSLHKSFFLTCKNYVGKNIKALTNPAWLEVEGVRYLGTSGQNVNDILKYLTNEMRQDPQIVFKVMAGTLKWQNIAPTAPDTLFCYPFDNCDPFTLSNETPHVYFVGNQSKFIDKCINLQNNISVKLLSIPKFSQTGEIVLLDTCTLETQIVKIVI